MKPATPIAADLSNGKTAADQPVRQRLYKFEGNGNQRLTHHLFRFPAKFHPPIVRQLVRDYTKPRDVILDPFCGSGTLMVEASVAGRDSIGIDVDPVSVFVSRVKAHAIPAARLENTHVRLCEKLTKLQRSAEELESLAKEDLSEASYKSQLANAWVPAIPNLEHWFFRYAIVDLARLLRVIDQLDVPETHRRFLRLVFAATIRNASRADPVPVSGLEVTKVMLEKERLGRRVDVFALFLDRLRRAIAGMREFTDSRDPRARCATYRCDAASMHGNVARRVDAVITSPPYHGAVDYYRRHQLEMFWLGFTQDQAQRLELLSKYLGRPTVPQTHEYVQSASLGLPNVSAVEEGMRTVAEGRARAFKHYVVGMSRALQNLASRMEKNAPLVLVVGHSSWNGGSIDTSALMADLAAPEFDLGERYFYPVKNRYMSYARHNAASIDREYVLVFRRTSKDR